MTNQRRLLVIEPYFGGSHQAFLEGLMRHVTADYTLLQLPARSWKRRMQLAAPVFAAEIAGLAASRRRFDAVLCSSFVDVALLRVLLQRLPGWNPKTIFCTYFHENQFAYPGQYVDNAIRQFQYINFTTALASDRLAFNSSFNRKSFLRGCHEYLKKAGGLTSGDAPAKLLPASVVLPPGIDFTAIDAAEEERGGRPPVIVWNHRWEHDKNPEEFFAVLHALKKQGVDFRLIVLGQSFAGAPDCFVRARDLLQERILHFGYADSRMEYARLLRKGDVVVSTAHHEFFGIAVLEAVRAGCRPLLPDRLSYPELFPEGFLYHEGLLEQQLALLLQDPDRLNRETARRLTQPFSWTHLAAPYQEWLFDEFPEMDRSTG